MIETSRTKEERRVIIAMVTDRVVANKLTIYPTTKTNVIGVTTTKVNKILTRKTFQTVVGKPI